MKFLNNRYITGKYNHPIILRLRYNYPHWEGYVTERAAGSGVEQSSMMVSNRSPSIGNIWLRLARLIALAFMLFCVFLFVVGVAAFNEFAALNPDLFTVYSWSAEEMAGVLGRLGLSFNLWLQLYQLIAILSAVIFCSVGGLIFIRKRDDWFSLYVAVWMVMFGTIVTTQMNAAAWWYPSLANVIFQIGGLPWPMLFLLFYLFPDGHFVPRWTRWVGLAIVIEYLVIVAFYGNGDPPAIIVLGLLAAMTIGIASQFYRYRRVSNAVQRQQTKWVVVALLVLFGLLILNAMPLLLPALRNSGAPPAILLPLFSLLADLAFLLFPLSIGIAILRYRLWDVDFLIRRTLVYGALTATLLVIYIITVVLLQSLIGRISGSMPGVAIVASTLLIAALFTPLRRRIQRDIDRRFYRRKYDAQQTVAGFAASVRDEVELEQMTTKLLAVVDDTLHPESVSIWMQPVTRSDYASMRPTWRDPMASETYYYAWQNPVLRNTIYPFRDIKLRDFLLIYKEVDLWAQNKNRNPSDPVIATRLQTVAQRARAQREKLEAALQISLKERIDTDTWFARITAPNEKNLRFKRIYYLDRLINDQTERQAELLARQKSLLKRWTGTKRVTRAARRGAAAPPSWTPPWLPSTRSWLPCSSCATSSSSKTACPR